MDTHSENGRITLPSGTDYRLLLLPNLTTMRPAVAQKIQGLAEVGAVLVAPVRPTQSPSLRDRGAGDAIVRSVADALFGNDATGPIDHRVGSGRLFSGMGFADVFARLGMPPDFEYRPAEQDAEVLYIHRRIGGIDAYFLSNQKDRVEVFEALFRVGAKTPELWDPATGAITRPGVFRAEGEDRVRLPLRLDPNGSVFVLFRDVPDPRHAVALEGATDGQEPAPPAPVPPAGLSTAGDTFTLAAWVKPDVEISLPPERKAAVAFQKQNWVVFPPQGQAQFGDGHAGAGIAAGSNGIVVFEHSAR